MYFYVLRRGKKFLELPYVVKGMDVSFSGLLSFIEVLFVHLRSYIFSLSFTLYLSYCDVVKIAFVRPTIIV